jgi:hypothetical protein
MGAATVRELLDFGPGALHKPAPLRSRLCLKYATHPEGGGPWRLASVTGILIATEEA